jgi:hypothetical protein
LFTILVKYEDSEEASYDIRKERLTEVISRVVEVDNLSYIKILPKKTKPNLKNNFEA